MGLVQDLEHAARGWLCGILLVPSALAPFEFQPQLLSERRRRETLGAEGLSTVTNLFDCVRRVLQGFVKLSPLLPGRRLRTVCCGVRDVVRDAVLFKEGRGIANWDRRPRRLCSLLFASGQRHRAVTHPAAFDESDHRMGIHCQDRGAALAQRNGMAQQEDFRGGSRLLQFCLLDGEHCPRRVVFNGQLKGLRILQVGRVKRNRKHGLPRDSRSGSQRQESHAIVAGKRIGICPENGDVVLGIGRDDGSGNQLWRAVRARHQDGGLPAILKGFQEMRDRQEVALIVDEKRVAEESVVISAPCG